jgi:hypothetical protein
LSNKMACLRVLLSCRANEALKQNSEVNRRESQAAADAANGLVGLAAAAAAADATGDAAAAAAAAVVPARSGSLAAFTVTGGTSDVDTVDGDEGGVFSRERSEVPNSSGKLQQQQQAPQQPVVQLPLSLPQQQQQGPEVSPSAGLAVQQQQLSPRVGKPSDDGGVDAAAVEAAEGLHMLMKSSGSFTERTAAGTAAAAAAAAAAGVEAAGVKRKLEESATGVEQDAAALGNPQQQQQQLQLAEALATAAGCSLAASSGTAAAQQQQQQQLAWPAGGSTPFQAAANLPAMQLAHIQQQLVQKLHQQQQKQQAVAAAAAGSAQPQPSASLAAALQLQHYNSAGSLAAAAAAASMPAASALSTGSMPVSSAAYAGAAAGGEKPAKRQRLNGVQMAELVASVRHHVQANPERYTHCVIRDMKEKYPELELNMGQVGVLLLLLTCFQMTRFSS